MNVLEKNRLTKEAEMQSAALKRIGRWRFIALALSTVAVAMIYAGFAGLNQNLFMIICGVILLLLSVGCVIVLNRGLVNGRKNVEKILNVLERSMEVS